MHRVGQEKARNLCTGITMIVVFETGLEGPKNEVYKGYTVFPNFKINSSQIPCIVTQKICTYLPFKRNQIKVGKTMTVWNFI